MNSIALPQHIADPVMWLVIISLAAFMPIHDHVGKNKILWSTIRVFVASKIAKSSYFWIVIVPIIAKMLEKIPPGTCIMINFSGSAVCISLDIPFSWQLFYFGSICMSVAQLIYAVQCPSIIKDFAHFEDFKLARRGAVDLRKQIVEFAGYKNVELQNFSGKSTTKLNLLVAANEYTLKELMKIYEEKNRGYIEELQDILSYDFIKMLQILRANRENHQVDLNQHEAILSDSFWRIRDYYNTIKSDSRALCVLFYSGGPACFLYVLGENFLFVIR